MPSEPEKLTEANKYKELGNTAFKNADWSGAIDQYTKAIDVLNDESRDTAIYLKNRAAAYLKMDRFKEALEDCDRSLKITPMDPKALYRRCQALEALERFEEAYRDARNLLNVDPTNKTIQPVLERLFQVTQERSKQNAQIVNKVDQMKKIAFDATIGDKEKRETAFNNLLVLAKEKAGSMLMIQNGVVAEIKRLLKIEKHGDICVSAIRVIGELCKHDAERTVQVLRSLGVEWFLEVLDSPSERRVNAAQYCMQVVLNSLSGMESRVDSPPPNKLLCEQNKDDIDALLACLVGAIDNRAISGLARDSLLELLMRNVHYDALAWAERLVEMGGVERLMEVASELEEYKYESSMNITPSTRTVAAVCLARVYENMYYDQLRLKFMDRIDAFVKGKLLQPDMESKVRVVVAITALLRGPLDVGNAVIGKEGIMEMILVMANTQDDLLVQKVACECIIAAASKKDKAKAIIAQGVDILKHLFKSKHDAIRVRALVGLCKLGSSGGNDASVKPFADGSNLKLAEGCVRFLLHPGKEQDIRKWAAEGLSYLTLDAEVKEKVVENSAALSALVELSKTGDQSVLYGVVTTLVNLCNAYEKQEMVPEMIELAKFAKHHIPEEHALDNAESVARRVRILADASITTALVALSRTESPNSQELIARVFNALCSEVSVRGTVVQQGGSRVLIPLSLRGTDKGKRHAAQALARIAITIDPAVAFPGQRALEVIRPLVNLLAPDCCALENFEALMALCNIAQMGENARQRILKEGGVGKVENYMYEDHLMLCRAATQTMCNLTLSMDVVELHELPNDKVKFLVALTLEEDLETCQAAAGALAILTSGSKKCCEKVPEAKSWLEAFKYMLSHANSDVQHRGVVILRNLLECSKELAQKVIDTDLMEVLMAVTKLDASEKNKVVSVAEECLKVAESYGIIKKPDQSVDPFVLAQNEINNEEREIVA